MIKCCKCGEVFDDYEVEQRSEYVAEFWGAPAYQNVDICPFCHSDDLEDIDDTEVEE